jgi:hypothetical protein
MTKVYNVFVEFSRDDRQRIMQEEKNKIESIFVNLISELKENEFIEKVEVAPFETSNEDIVTSLSSETSGDKS